ncbi:hypothetical protein [Marinivivus vitaminiproducens]|uniref:hypothetical protein n=1 Tax=Marinivivus vitaminiproducens TaxID=3035935 RepID=UPI0027AB1930|nr:hypothetical protein P4R82_01255 [Geminicoccaceae bacterium SCSIO 64248]
MKRKPHSDERIAFASMPGESGTSFDRPHAWICVGKVERSTCSTAISSSKIVVLVWVLSAQAAMEPIAFR